MRYLKWSAFTVLLLQLFACSFLSPYEPPKEGQPYALLKLKYKYSEVTDGTTLGARMGVRHDAKSDKDGFHPAFNKHYGKVNKKGPNPDIAMEAVKVHPGKNTDINMAVYFYWYTTQSYMIMVNNVPQMQTQQVYNENACNATVNFVPKAGKVYILDYSSPTVDRDCTVNAYEQVKTKGDKFKLVKVSSSKAAQ